LNKSYPYIIFLLVLSTYNLLTKLFEVSNCYYDNVYHKYDIKTLILEEAKAEKLDFPKRVNKKLALIEITYILLFIV